MAKKLENLSKKSAKKEKATGADKTKKPSKIPRRIKEAAKKLRETKPKGKRNQKRDRDTSAEHLKILERQNLVLDLTIGGASRRQISAHLKSKGYDASVGTVQTDLVNALEELHETKLLKTHHWVELEINRINQMWFAVWTTFIQPPVLMDVYQRIAIGYLLIALQNKRDKYLGLSKAQKIKIEVDPRDLLAKLTGKKPENFPAPVNE
jgi:hypothetical protein